MARRYHLYFAVTLCACPGPAVSPHPPIDPHGSGSQRPDAGATIAPSPNGPTDAECSALVAHALEIGIIDYKRGGSAAEPTPDEAAKIRTDLDAELRPGCRALARARYACAIAAPDPGAMAACDSLPNAE